MQNSLFYDYYALIDSCSFLKKYSAHIKCISDLVRDLESRPILAEMCGFNPGQIPDASRFS